MRLWLLVFLPAAALAYCDALRGKSNFCAAKLHIAFDATTYMGTPDNVAQVFYFLRDLLSGYQENATMYDINFYGSSYAGWEEHFVNTHDGMCEAFAELESRLPNNTVSMNIITLTQLLETWSGEHDIVLFTATTDQDDINRAGAMTNGWTAQNNITIVYMGNSTYVDFSSWRNTQVLCARIPVQSWLLFSIPDTQCGVYSPGTSCRGTTPAPTDVPVTVNPTTTPPPQYTTPPNQPTVAPTPNTNNTSQCPCDLSKVWNDVFVLFDGSTGLHKYKFQEMTDFVVSSFSQISIGQALQFNTRVGISVYGSNVTNIAPLDQYQSFNNLLSQYFEQQPNDPYTNVKDAIDQARAHFELKESRPYARKVILIAASTYRDGNYEDPLVVAETFKRNGGIIIVVEYGDVSGKTSAVLKQVASPGYYVDATTSTPDATAFSNLQCAANCFCPQDYTAVSTSASGAPTGGCYFVSDLQSVQQLASRQCSRLTSGQLAMPMTTQQKITLVHDKAPVWVGLKKVSGMWLWADGSECTDNVSPTGTGNCAYIQRAGSGFATRFVEAECSTPYKFSCQVSPCSSTNMCS